MLLSSPPKRRKTNRAAAIDAPQTKQPSLNQDTRARSHDPPSFLLPTNASPPRSNSVPERDETNRSPTRSPSRATRGNGQDGQQAQAESRVFGLRDRKALRPSLGSMASPMSALRMSPRRTSGGLQVFAAPPRRVSRRIMPSDLAFGSPIAREKMPESAQANTPRRKSALELDGAPGELDADMDHFPSIEGLEEPELPPTPTQLGLELPPGRRKGLMSSSPSTRHGRWARRRISNAGKSSTLKAKDIDTGGEPEDMPEAGLLLDRYLFPEAVLKKQKLKRDLSTELQQLKDDIAELEAWTEKLNDPDKFPDPQTEDFSKFISLLASGDSSRTTSRAPQPNVPMSSLLSTLLPFSKKPHRATRQTSPSPKNPFALQEPAEAGPYLKAFAPLDLESHSNEVSASKSDLRESHSLTFFAPSPFPPSLYNVSVAYESNPETQSLTAVSIPKHRGNSNLKIPETLRHWMDCRLANPLLKLDVSGLCWGINRYWEAMVWRAQIWSKLENQHSELVARRRATINPDISNDKTPGRTSSPRGDGVDLTKSDLRRLIAHLERSSMLFDSVDGAAKLHLSCTLTMNEWTSEPELMPEISIQASSTMPRDSKGKVEEEARKVFHSLLRENTAPSENGSQRRGIGIVDVDAIIRAMEGVLGVLFAEA